MIHLYHALCWLDEQPLSVNAVVWFAVGIVQAALSVIVAHIAIKEK